MSINVKKLLLESPRIIKQLIAVITDAVICVLAVQIGMDLRMETHGSWSTQHTWLTFLGLSVFLPIFLYMGLYRSIFRHTGLYVIFRVNKAFTVYTLIYASIFTVFGIDQVPLTMGILQPLLFWLGITSSRLFVRSWLGDFDRRKMLPKMTRSLVYGAGEAGRQLVTGLSKSTDINVVGYVDDDKQLHGHNLNGYKIYSPIELASVIERKNVNQIYLAMPSVNQRRRNEIIKQLLPLRVKVRTLPGVSDLALGKVNVSDIRELNIDDLLGRAPVSPDPLMLQKNIFGKVVMVTGAGGSIGSELCRQILLVKPSTLILVELSEYSLYEIHRELVAVLSVIENQESVGETDHLLNSSPKAYVNKLTVLIPLLADVRDANRMAAILQTWRPSILYHAAAFKHVPIVEHNPAEGVKNNVLGTFVTATQAELNGVKDFVLISTDKAVRPTNIMGATKRLAEMILQAKANSQLLKYGPEAINTRFTMVRFGNVLGSSGSVVPLFSKQIIMGGPITLTDVRMTRYFMTIKEAAQLVIQSAAMATGGDVFVLDMGEPVKIVHLAKRMVQLSGLTLRDIDNPDGDIEIQTTGLRPGEKLYEELLIGDNPIPTIHPLIMKAHEDFLPFGELECKLKLLIDAVNSNDVSLIRVLLKELVSGYKPEGEVVDWVWLERKRLRV
jgi:FlaA1/EpsC-like NDP-sugar epimerase